MPKARILAVDDQRYFRELIEGLLTGEGYEVQTASSGEEALHILEREDFDVVITDLVMPGIDGTELVQTVKERSSDQDIIMVTGVVDVKTAVEAMKLGASDYVPKPFDNDELELKVARVLETMAEKRENKLQNDLRLLANELEERKRNLYAVFLEQPQPDTDSQYVHLPAGIVDVVLARYRVADCFQQVAHCRTVCGKPAVADV